METAAYPRRVIMRAFDTDQDNLATIAAHLKSAGVKPTISAVLRHALQIAAIVAEVADATRPTGKDTAKG